MVGSIRRLRPALAYLTLALVLFSVALVIQPAQRVHAEQCVFPFTPTAYEDIKDRKLFLDTIELAAANMLFPGDPYFGVPDIEYGPRSSRSKEPGKVPPVLLKSIAWIESSITQGGGNVPFGSIGPALISFDCGHGVAQVTTGMTIPTGENGRGSPEQALVATHFAYNIARGAYILVDKWNEAPDTRPIAGIDTNGHPMILENWYFAVWGYNGFTGPGSNKSNHPLDPIYGSWPRMPYSCGPANDGKGHNRAAYPYQELVFGCAANPPVSDGVPLWQAQQISLPDLNQPQWRNALRLENFTFPYSGMDIMTPPPFHMDSTPPPDASDRQRILGSPSMVVSKESARVGYEANGGSTVDVIDIVNTGTGVLAWYAQSTVPWLTITPYTGVAVGGEMPCTPGNPCDRVGHMEISVDSTRVPPGRHQATVLVRSLGSNQSATINVEVIPVVRVGVPGVTRN